MCKPCVCTACIRPTRVYTDALQALCGRAPACIHRPLLPSRALLPGSEPGGVAVGTSGAGASAAGWPACCASAVPGCLPSAAPLCRAGSSTKGLMGRECGRGPCSQGCCARIAFVLACTHPQSTRQSGGKALVSQALPTSFPAMTKGASACCCLPKSLVSSRKVRSRSWCFSARTLTHCAVRAARAFSYDAHPTFKSSSDLKASPCARELEPPRKGWTWNSSRDQKITVANPKDDTADALPSRARSTSPGHMTLRSSDKHAVFAPALKPLK